MVVIYYPDVQCNDDARSLQYTAAQATEEYAMIDAKQAVKLAMDYLNEMYKTEDFRDILLEEVELTGDDKLWNVTVGFDRKQASTTAGPMASLVGPAEMYQRETRVFTIDAETGVVRSMKLKKSE
jgi:hypothetical protein